MLSPAGIYYFMNINHSHSYTPFSVSYTHLVQCGGECQPSEQQVTGYNLHSRVYHVAHVGVTVIHRVYICLLYTSLQEDKPERWYGALCEATPAAGMAH